MTRENTLGSVSPELILGRWSDYQKTWGTSSITLSRAINGHTETVTVVSTAGNGNDRLIFADGSVLSLDAKTALQNNPQTPLNAIPGYNPNDTSPSTLQGIVSANVKYLIGTGKSRYLHRDHLGSLTAITDDSGTVIERLAYDPWGKRRFPNGTTDPNNNISPQTTDRGFTDHEHLDEIGLIHMNGRIYDPLLGRFLSADPHIQAPEELQSYNRYSYVMNNPLGYTDPSGYSWLSKTWKKVWHSTVGKIVVTVAVAYFTGYYNYNYGTLASPSYGVFGASATGLSGGAAAFGNAVTAGFAGGFVGSGGTLQGGLQGVLSGALFYGAGSFADAQGWASGSLGRAAAHAVAGCLGSSASGSRCGSGALSAGFAEGIGGNLNFESAAANLITHTVIGGTASALGGGKFANGGITAAFGYMFNHVAHNGFTLRNPNVVRNLNALNQELINMGYKDEDFVLSVTGGDRYRDSEGNIRSATNDSIVGAASKQSPHLYERGARAVDLDVRGVSQSDFNAALQKTQFDPSSTGRDYPNAPHTHINLFNRKELYYPLSDSVK